MRTAQWFAGTLLLAAGCHRTTSPSLARDAGVDDGAMLDAGSLDTSVADVDASYDDAGASDLSLGDVQCEGWDEYADVPRRPFILGWPPWIATDGAVILPRYTVRQSPCEAIPHCGTHQAVSHAGWTNNHTVCPYRSWVYFSFDRLLYRYLDNGWRLSFLFDARDNFRDGAFMIAACAPSSLVLGAYHSPSQSVSLLQFEDPEGQGRVIWSGRRASTLHGELVASFNDVAASDALTAWSWREHSAGSGIDHLYVAGPHGESPREIAVRGDFGRLSASGRRLVYRHIGDIWLWEVGAERAENLTHDNVDQRDPWIDGDRVVWSEGPHGTTPSDADTEVVLLDLRTRARKFLTVDPPDHPAAQGEPSIQGDWVVWTDTRHSTRANPQGVYLGRTAIYAHNVRTDQEINLTPSTPDDEYPTSAWIHDGRVMFHCQRPPERSGIVAMNLPVR